MSRRAVRTAGTDPIRGLSLLVAVATLAAGCGSGPQLAARAPGPLHAADLPGWHETPDAPGIGELAPDLSGLDVVRRADSPALVRRGDAVRSSLIELATPADAAAALARARAPDQAALLERAFRGDVRRRTAGAGWVGYRLTVPRPAEPGTDTAELYYLRRGQAFVLVELVSGAGFPERLRDRILALVSR
jgi:hypothetical protein